ncbi:MAG: FAD-dependent oxidoreductase, partial [Planctomycetes bacterium]|nr:FAD-dependent oxidoreductase [Planctomycetota bacterium]
MTDVIIIGAGIAGLFAAHELSKNSKLSVLIIEKGKDIQKRRYPRGKSGEGVRYKPSDVMCGVGGAGGMSDGTLNLRYDVGGDLTDFTDNVSYARSLVDEVDTLFLEHGASKEVYGESTKDTEKLTRRAASVGVKFIHIPQRHIGSEYLPNVIGSLKRKLEKQGVKFKLNTEVERIERGAVIVKGRRVKAKYILAAPGRIGAFWLSELARKLNIEFTHGAIDVGVRVEIPAVVMEPVIKVSRDPKFHITTKTFDDFVRTFCTNHQGYVVQEQYDGFSGVNGHAMRTRKSE